MWNDVCRFPGDNKTNYSTKTLRLRYTKKTGKISKFWHVTPSGDNPWRRQDWPAEIFMLSFQKISGKTWFYFLENPAKHHYDSIQAFDSNKYEYTCSFVIVENHARFCFFKNIFGVSPYTYLLQKYLWMKLRLNQTTR